MALLFFPWPTAGLARAVAPALPKESGLTSISLPANTECMGWLHFPGAVGTQQGSVTPDPIPPGVLPQALS